LGFGGEAAGVLGVYRGKSFWGEAPNVEENSSAVGKGVESNTDLFES